MTTIITKDALRASVEASTGGKCTVMYDDKGYPSYMRKIEKFNMEDLDANLGTGVHPAFLVGGVEKSEIWVGQYQAIVKDGRALSLPGYDPKTSVDFDQARTYCQAKGAGWHLMTAFEWAAVMQLILKNEIDGNYNQPRGNTESGRAHDAQYETGVRPDGYPPGDVSGTRRTLSGSGPAAWRHDQSFTGIADLVGNVWEWNDLLKLVDGVFYCPNDNDISQAAAGAAGEDLWIARTTDPVSASWPASGGAWKSGGVTGDSLLLKLGVVPDYNSTTQLPLNANAKGTFYYAATGERMPRRGGSYGDAANAGVAALLCNYVRGNASGSIGCRLAYFE